MPEALDIPDDLIALERARVAAWDELITFSTRVAAERREQFPDPEQDTERRRWPPELADVLAGLRAAYYDVAATAVRHHPVMERALAERCHYATELALRAAAKEPAPA